jgi:hypothetical protein
VTPDEVRETVVAFLDQFVVRGATEDLRELRQGLPGDPELQRQLDRHLTANMTEREAFDAMRGFLSDVSTGMAPGDGQADVFDLLSWTRWEQDGITSDPAQWDDWLAAVAASGG